MNEIKRLQKLAGLTKENDDFDITVSNKWDSNDDLYIVAFLEVDMWDEENEASGEGLFKYEGKIKKEDLEDMSQNYYPYKFGMDVQEWLEDIQFNVWNVDGYLDKSLEGWTPGDFDFDIDKAVWENSINGWIDTAKII